MKERYALEKKAFLQFPLRNLNIKQISQLLINFSLVYTQISLKN